MEDARRFAFEEPYWLAGIYDSLTIARFQTARDGTMWDRPLPKAESGSALVLVTWRGQLQASSADADRQVLRMLSEIDAVVFGGLLISDHGRHSIGLVAAVDADIGRAAALMAGVGLPGSTTSITSRRWRRGGRAQT